MVLVTKKQKSPPLHHRKRQGHHHKRSGDYKKPYWPYLPLLSIIGFGFLLNILWIPLSQTVFSQSSVLSFATNTNIAALLAETNVQRGTSGTHSLSLNSQLNNAAQAKANDMATRNYWSHETPDGAQPWQFITNAGYAYTAAGENLAYGFDSSASTITGWMNSPGHRANLLNEAFNDVGFGIANAEDYQSHGQETIVVAMYGATTASPVTASPKQPVASAIQPHSNPSVASASTAAVQPSAGTTQPTAVPDPVAKENASSTTQKADQNSNSFGISMQVPERPRSVTRMELVSDTIPSWSIAATFSLIITGIAWFAFRHLRALHRTLIHGEQFIIRHPALDLVLISIVTFGILITRTAGFIN
jgi:uncharacterized protein YkwD